MNDNLSPVLSQTGINEHSYRLYSGYAYTSSSRFEELTCSRGTPFPRFPRPCRNSPPSVYLKKRDELQEYRGATGWLTNNDDINQRPLLVGRVRAVQQVVLLARPL